MTVDMLAREIEVAAESAPAILPEAQAAFDRTCRYYLKISGTEFLQKLDRGEIHRDQSNTAQNRVFSMLPLVGR